MENLAHECTYNSLINSLAMDCEPRLERLLFKICYHAAPTIEGIKPANLVMFRDGCAGCFKSDWYEFQEEIQRILPIKVRALGPTDKGINILFYNEDVLKRLLGAKAIGDQLKAIGYRNTESLDGILDQLSERFLNGCPNEIGIILGYPLYDVISFMANDKPCLMTGYWRVYSNAKRAKQLFERFDSSKSRFEQALRDGISPSQYLQMNRERAVLVQ